MERYNVMEIYVFLKRTSQNKFQAYNSTTAMAIKSTEELWSKTG